MGWYKPHDSVLFCPPSPDSALAKELQKIADTERRNGGISIKIVERAGRKLRSILPGMREENDCGREDCLVHMNDGKGRCDREGVVYRGTCIICEEGGKKALYIGESGRSAYARGKDHLKAIENPQSNTHNAFVKHMAEEHGEEEAKFRMDIIKAFDKPLERQVREGVEIMRMNADIRLNSKLDFIQPGMRRVAFQDLLGD